MNKNIADLRETSRKLFGSDIDVTLACHPSWGSENVVMLVHGALHPLAAAAIARCDSRATVELMRGNRFSTGEAYTYSSVTLPPK